MRSNIIDSLQKGAAFGIGWFLGSLLRRDRDPGPQAARPAAEVRDA